MAFKYKKTQYENIFRWNESGEGTCFYCKEDKPVEIKLINEKGICKDCLDNFEIGNIGADRHVIHQIMPEFKNHDEAKKWFEKMGVELIFKTKIEDIYIYDGINDEQKYKEMQNQSKEKGFTPMSEEFMNCYNSVEISEDGGIHIIY